MTKEEQILTSLEVLENILKYAIQQMEKKNINNLEQSSNDTYAKYTGTHVS